MTRQEIIQQLKPFFKIQELVCPEVYEAFGERAWQFFDKDFLWTLLIVRRDILKLPMYVNNWDGYHSYEANGELYTQRGLRCNLCELVKKKTEEGKIYMTSHANGGGIDFEVEGLSVSEVHSKIREKAYLLPVKVRMEVGIGVNWNHMDIYDDGSQDQFSEFRG